MWCVFVCIVRVHRITHVIKWGYFLFFLLIISPRGIISCVCVLVYVCLFVCLSECVLVGFFPLLHLILPQCPCICRIVIARVGFNGFYRLNFLHVDLVE